MTHRHICLLMFFLTLFNSTQPTERTLDDSTSTSRVQSINKGRGQEITGVTLPEKGKFHRYLFIFTYWHPYTYYNIKQTIQFNLRDHIFVCYPVIAT